MTDIQQALRGFVDQATVVVASSPPHWRTSVALLANSVGLGMVSALVTYIAVRGHAGDDKKTLGKALQGVANLLFLCVGLTGTMILVNNNMVRAFGVGAAIALVRFKINLNGKSSNASLLFSILSGIACGLGETVLAWILLATYVVLMGMTTIITRMMVASKVVEEETPLPEDDLTIVMHRRGVGPIAVGQMKSPYSS
jgi:hypothetical protein